MGDNVVLSENRVNREKDKLNSDMVDDISCNNNLEYHDVDINNRLGLASLIMSPNNLSETNFSHSTPMHQCDNLDEEENIHHRKCEQFPKIDNTCRDELI